MATRYAELCDLQQKFGTQNVTAWSNLDNTNPNVDMNRVNKALDWASEYVDNRLRSSKYLIPLAPTGADSLLIIVDTTASLAGWYLYTGRGFRDTDDSTMNKLQRFRDMADADLDRILNGQIAIAAQINPNSGPTAPTIS